ncbi:MAG: tetratricopeptide repeat protein [Verrucomicrobiota bacterium]|nr:tetratricopeptide repeat protein [Verrucomicrobiota bacterium]
MFFWRRVAPQIPEEGLKPTATPGYTRNFRDLNDQVSRGKSFSGYERNALFMNRAGRGFSEVGNILNVDFEDDARAVATVDWDRDGDLDMWVANRSAPQVRLLRNNQSSSNASIAVRLIGNGTTSNRDAIGARLTLSRSANPAEKQIRTLRAGDGFLAQSSSWTHFGLGEGEKDSFELEVRWPGGGVEKVAALRSGARYTMVQDQGILDTPEPISTTAGKKDWGTKGDGGDTTMSGFWVANRVPFPKLTCVDQMGTTRSTTDFLGKPVLINLWATWCNPCLQELGELGKHADDLAAMGATVLALNVDGLAVDGTTGRGSDPERLLAKMGYTLPRGVARQENLAKIEILIEYLTSRRASLSVPTSILVDAQGKTAAVYLEALSWERLSGDLALLNATPAETLERASPRSGRWLTDPRQVDLPAYLGDYATLFGINGFPEESQRLYQLVRPEEGVRTAREFYNQAKSASQQGLLKEAMELYRDAIRIDPDYGQALTGLGAILLNQKRIDEAQPLFEKAIQLDPHHATALINLAMIEQIRGDMDSAIERLRGVVDRNPEYHEAYLNLGSVLASTKNYDEAITHLSKAVELNPKMVVAHLNLAKAYAATGQLEKSEASYRDVMNLNPRMPYPYYGLGLLQARQGDHHKAVSSFREAISLGARNPTTLTKLGISLLAEGDRDRGVMTLKQALEMNPEHAGARQALSNAGLADQ